MFEIMNQLFNELTDNLFPIGGSIGGGFIAISHNDVDLIFGWVSLPQMMDIILTMAIGAVVGWFVKLGLDYCKKSLIKHRKHEKK